MPGPSLCATKPHQSWVTFQLGRAIQPYVYCKTGNVLGNTLTAAFVLGNISPGEVLPKTGDDAMSFQSEWVKCGNPRCRSCPHGPYWYEYWREGKTVKKRYHGRNRPGAGQGNATAAPPEVKWYEAMLTEKTASLKLALRILELPGLPKTRSDLTKAYRKKMLVCHPDRGGDHLFAQCVNAAYSYCKTFDMA